MFPSNAKCLDFLVNVNCPAHNHSGINGHTEIMSASGGPVGQTAAFASKTLDGFGIFCWPV
jgi:hypothetical protein